jgi:hypothetical protein
VAADVDTAEQLAAAAYLHNQLAAGVSLDRLWPQLPHSQSQSQQQQQQARTEGGAAAFPGSGAAGTAAAGTPWHGPVATAQQATPPPPRSAHPVVMHGAAYTPQLPPGAYPSFYSPGWPFPPPYAYCMPPPPPQLQQPSPQPPGLQPQHHTPQVAVPGSSVSGTDPRAPAAPAAHEQSDFGTAASANPAEVQPEPGVEGSGSGGANRIAPASVTAPPPQAGYPTFSFWPAPTMPMSMPMPGYGGPFAAGYQPQPPPGPWGPPSLPQWPQGTWQPCPPPPPLQQQQQQQPHRLAAPSSQH